MHMFIYHDLPDEAFSNPRAAPPIPNKTRSEPLRRPYRRRQSVRKSEFPSQQGYDKLWQSAGVEHAYRPNRRMSRSLSRSISRSVTMSRSRSRASVRIAARTNLSEAKAHFHQAGRDIKFAVSLAVSAVKNVPGRLIEKRERRRCKSRGTIHSQQIAEEDEIPWQEI